VDTLVKLNLLKGVISFSVKICGRFAKSFILLISNGLDVDDTYALTFFPKFYFYYTQLVLVYNIEKLITLFFNNVIILVYGEQ
jgi:hypothetical protein